MQGAETCASRRQYTRAPGAPGPPLVCDRVLLGMTLTFIADDLTGACDNRLHFSPAAPVGVIAEPSLVRSDASVVAGGHRRAARSPPRGGPFR